jgi:hypothetical protein
MTRFTASGDTLRIEIDDSSADPYAIAAAWALVRAGARNVYFRGHPGRIYPSIQAAANAGIHRVEEGEEPSDFLSSTRVLHAEGELVVVSARNLRKDQWRTIASEIEAAVASHDAAP